MRIFLPLRLTTAKSYPLLIVAVTPIPIGVTYSGPLSFALLALIFLSAVLPPTATLFSGIPSFSASIFERSGIRLPPPTRNTAAGGSPLAFIMFSAIFSANEPTAGNKLAKNSDVAIVWSNPRISR